MTTMPYDGDDFYCEVAIPRKVDLDVVHDCDRVLAFRHTRPSWPTHIVVVPKRHIASLTAVRLDDEPDVMALLAVVRQVALKVENSEGAARVSRTSADTRTPSISMSTSSVVNKS